MRILTWNINGIRASKIPLKSLFDSLDADIICLQETKVTRDQLDEKTAVIEGYNSFFSFSKVKSGYSGVATYVREDAVPYKAEEGLSGGMRNENEEHNIGCYGDHADFSDEELKALDNEGRTIITQHKIMTDGEEEKLLTIINVYCPRADPEKEDRLIFKQRFYQLLQIRAENILKNDGHVIIVGDVNTSHKRIDHCEGDDPDYRFAKKLIREFELKPGRVWLDEFLWNPEAEEQIEKATVNKVSCQGGQFVDTFRYFHPDQRNAFTCWSTVTGARATNYGTRIDYIFADLSLTKAAFTDCIIQPDVQGSDHCPVKATLNCQLLPSKKCPPLCTKYMPEFTGKQQKLLSYFKKTDKNVEKDMFLTSVERPKDVSKVAMKREADQSQEESMPKKLKKDDKRPSGTKQASLMSFFTSKNAKGKEPTLPNLLQKSSNDSQNIKIQSNKELESSRNSLQNMKSDDVKPKKDVSNSWKNLLKGPAAPPTCKGHNEPCVLRTVKKDSLNKGRQFYVCCRPDGHKSNVEARCDHFEWVDKKKK